VARWNRVSLCFKNPTMQYEAVVKLLHRFHNAHVLVLGDVMLDRFVYGVAERISPEAPIPVVSVERTLDMPGGAANVARNVSALGAQCTLLGIVGADAAAEKLRAQLALSPAILVHLISDPARPTTLKTRYVADGQQMMRADWERTDALSSDVAHQLLTQFAAALNDADIVVLSDYAKGVLSDVVIREAIRIARQYTKPVVVDPKSKNLRRYAGATVLTPNRLELRGACGIECLSDSQVTQGAGLVLEQGICGALVVTRGKEGMSVIESDGTVVHLPTGARQVYDVSGAGDTVIATLALGMAAGGEVVESAALANVAAGIVVGKRGTATVTPGEIMASMPPFGRHADPLKIYSVDNVLPLVREWRERGLKVAFTNGCFDLLHPGHISLLDQARRSADRLVVGLNADVSVQGELARATVLAAVKSVDAVVIFASDTPLELIDALRPDVLVKGADYTVQTVVGAEEVSRYGGRVLLAQLVAGYSTTETVARVTCSSSA
jgi:D-beta-D-heptose 7-phosphate kinase / D-beta-D-heptose 1-phosphate adenosyltransferase